MNISDLNNIMVNQEYGRLTLVIGKGFQVHCEPPRPEIPPEEAKALIERLVPLEEYVFYDPKYDKYLKGLLFNATDKQSKVLELVDITEIYLKYKNAKSNYEMYQIDALTKLPVRGKLDEDILGYISYAAQSGEPFAILMCDIDHFKNFNDTYGHQFGDRVLATVANAMSSSVRQDSIRKKDIVGRYGGEEFLLALKNVNEEQAFTIAEKIRKNVEQASVDGKKVTISIGVFATQCKIPNAQDLGKEELKKLRDEMILCADIALYESKENGRNRCTIYDDSLQALHIKKKKLTFPTPLKINIMKKQ